MVRGLILTAVLLLLSTGSAGAQSIRGVVRDGTTREPVSFAEVLALDARGSTIAATLTDAEGAFSVPLSARASVRLRVARIGFQTFETESVALHGSEVLTLEIRLLPDPVEIDEVSVVSRWQNRNRERFERRRHSEISAQFLGPERLADYRMSSASSLLAVLLPRVTALPNGSIQVRSRGVGFDNRRTCAPDIHVDGVRIPAGSPVDIFVSGNTIRGIEFYPDAIFSPFLLSRVPSYDGATRSQRITSPCVVVVIWTARAFGEQAEPSNTDD